MNLTCDLTEIMAILVIFKVGQPCSVLNDMWQSMENVLLHSVEYYIVIVGTEQ